MTYRSSNLLGVTKASIGPLKRSPTSKYYLFNAYECSYNIYTLYIRTFYQLTISFSLFFLKHQSRELHQIPCKLLDLFCLALVCFCCPSLSLQDWRITKEKSATTTSVLNHSSRTSPIMFLTHNCMQIINCSYKLIIIIGYYQ